MNGFFAILNRLKFIDRWGLMHSVRKENVLEHSALTAIFVHALALIENELFCGKYNVERAVLLALYHEAAEALTGDLPTPVKYYDEKITAAYKEIERKAEEKIKSSVPSVLSDKLESLICQDKTAPEAALVKAADKLSALVKCFEEIRAGNPEFGGAYESTLNEVSASPLKSVQMFLTEFFPAFGFTLDALQR